MSSRTLRKFASFEAFAKERSVNFINAGESPKESGRRGNVALFVCFALGTLVGFTRKPRGRQIFHGVPIWCPTELSAQAIPARGPGLP